ncbi:uncharacterized protein YecE (DUF72 family) [Pedobacter sp. UYEF25]
MKSRHPIIETDVGRYYSGTSGLLLPVPNKSYYPENYRNKSRLSYYSSLMNSIEINSSFYKIPLSSTVKNWALDVPDGFKFTFKLFKEITHNKGLVFEQELLRRFFHVISQVGEKRGCLLVQLPPSVRLTHFLQLQSLMAALRENDPDMRWNIAVEFRHQSLYVAEVYELLESFNLSVVIHDKIPSSTPLMTNNIKFVYLRFHGPEGNYRGSYEENVLAEYASYITEWFSEGKKVFVYFNNTMGRAHSNLFMLRQFVSDFSKDNLQE